MVHLYRSKGGIRDNKVESFVGDPGIVWSCPIMGCHFICGSAWEEHKVHVVVAEDVQKGLNIIFRELRLLLFAASQRGGVC